MFKDKFAKDIIINEREAFLNLKLKKKISFHIQG